MEIKEFNPKHTLESIKKEFKDKRYYDSYLGLCTVAEALYQFKIITINDYFWFVDYLFHNTENDFKYYAENDFFKRPFIWDAFDRESRYNWLNEHIELFN